VVTTDEHLICDEQARALLQEEFTVYLQVSTPVQIERLTGYRPLLPVEDKNQSESRPVSRVLSWTVIYLGTASPQCSSNLPGSLMRAAWRKRTYIGSLFDLAPSGVCPATDVATSAVRSYRTISTLP
jgi:hypothetical protein